MNTPFIGHRAISASAGSGKTFQLAHRYIELMSKGVKADRIIALTFSRKAAGEIFDSVVKYLCEAASSVEEARKKAELIGKSDAKPEDFLKILRELLESLHRLHIGTLDSFTVGIARNFPLELGIPPHFQLLGEEGAAGDVRQMVLARVFGQGESDWKLRNEFLQAYSQATFGQEGKGLGDRLDTIIGRHHGHYQLLPRAEAWGREEYIWDWESPWWKRASERGAAVERLLDLLGQDGLAESVMQRWQVFTGAVLDYETGSSWPEDMKYLFEKLAANIESLLAGDMSFKIGRASQHLSEEESKLALALLAHVVNIEINIAQEKTQGIYRLLDLYERFYDAMLRRHGQLTFSDVQYLLTSGNQASGGMVISRQPSAEARLYIDYRLDCKLDHWLLDEFQDTSDLQWEVLQNLADEIVQDSSGERSLFYVGDTKQAIYGWRGGNARLFDRLLDYYGERIKVEPLSKSYRSCQAVIDTVNQAFGRIPEGLLPEGAVRQWERSWQTHECELGVVPATGYAAVLEPPCEEGKQKPVDDDRYRIVAGLLREIDPVAKGLSAAILVRSNKSGEEIVDFLRRECPGMSILHEGRASIKDNPVVSVLLSLVKFAAHPGDTLAWRHLQMSPLQKYFVRNRLNRENLPLDLLGRIQSGGFQGLVIEWGERLKSVHPFEGFGLKRLGELTSAAIEFDRTGSRDCDAFLRFIDSYEVHDMASSLAVRVMTVHQSKGLGFDVVLLPDLQKENMASSGQPGFVLARHPQSEEPLWALEMPRRVVAETDEVLAEQVRLGDETAAFDSLCLLYVAMTRAKRGLYIVTGFPGKSSKTVTHAAFLKQQLAGDPKAVEGRTVLLGDEEAVCLYETGNSDWHRDTSAKEEIAARAVAARLSADFREQPSIRERFTRIQPSKTEVTVRSASSLFALDNRESKELGTAIHELFEKITWIEETDIEELLLNWSSKSTIREELKQKTEELFREAVDAPEIRKALTKPSGDVSLWRERKFEVVEGNRWISGAFDRVVVTRGGGKVLKAEIIDFKSDEIPDDTMMAEHANHYRPQMELYRSALSEILRIDPDKITLRILFLRPGKVYDLD